MAGSFCSTSVDAAHAGNVDLFAIQPKKFESITLYWHMIDPNSRAIKSLLVAGGIKHNEVYVNLQNGEHKEPDFLALNPQGEIPFIIVDD